MTNRTHYFYYLIAVIPPLMGAANFVLAKSVNADIGPMSLLFWRWMVAWLVFFPFVIRDFLRNAEQIRENIKLICLCSLTGVAMFNALMYNALHYTTSINSSIISNIFPIFIIIIAYLTRSDSITPTKALSVFVALFGTVVIMTNGNLSQLMRLLDNLGDIIAILGALTFAVYSVLSRNKPTDIKITTFTFATITFGVMMIMPLYFIEVQSGSEIQWNENVIFTILFTAVPISIIGFSCWNYSVVKLGPATAGLIFYLAPVFNIIMATTLLNERFTYYHAVGLTMILIAVNLPLMKKMLDSRISRIRHSQRLEQSVDT